MHESCTGYIAGYSGCSGAMTYQLHSVFELQAAESLVQTGSSFWKLQDTVDTCSDHMPVIQTPSLNSAKYIDLRHHEPVNTLLQRIPHTARLVLIGEASHGTKEFYDQRAEITKALIQQRGFVGVVTEADFPDAYRCNCYIRGLSRDRNADEALSDFTRFPRWMWRNKSVESFLEWARSYNMKLPLEQRRTKGVGFYGMDVYSLHTSAAAVVKFIEENEPELLHAVKTRYQCFDRYGSDAQSYGMAVGAFNKPSCEKAAQAALKEVQHRIRDYLINDGLEQEEEALAAEANAMVVKGAESYYRQMFFRDEITWNLRDKHFFDIVQLIEKHCSRRQVEPRLVLWAHNSHLGDARATDMGQKRGELNIGQLCRESYGDAVFNIGFSTHTGTVAAASDWGDPMEVKRVNPSMQGSVEHAFHDLGLPHVAMDMREPENRQALKSMVLERAIGVIYRPATERYSHYFYANVPDQFNLVIHVENTNAVEPLPAPGATGKKRGVTALDKKRAQEEAEEELSPEGTHGDLPETFPMGV